jgi:prophage regulatory protein
MGRIQVVGLAEVAELLGGISRQRAAEIAARPTFPAPIGLINAGRIRVWDRADVVTWIREYRPHQRQQPED